jgi:hypothetical protein
MIAVLDVTSCSVLIVYEKFGEIFCSTFREVYIGDGGCQLLRNIITNLPKDTMSPHRNLSPWCPPPCDVTARFWRCLIIREWTVRSVESYTVTTLHCHHPILSPPYNVTIIHCHHPKLSPSYTVTTLHCHHPTLSLPYTVTTLHCHHPTLSPPYTLTILNCHHPTLS